MHRTSILLIGYKSERWLTKCIDTLRTASEHRLQLCFVDNLDNPTWSDQDVSDFDVEVLKTPRPMGFAEANNFGLKHTQFGSDYTVFLNQDTVSTPGWIDACATCFAENKSLGILSPGLRTYDLSEWEPNLVACFNDSDCKLSQLDEGRYFSGLKHVTAAAMLMRTDLVDAHGGFDPIFGSYYEDYDLCHRILAAGHEIGVCPEARVGHFSGSVATDPVAKKKRYRLLIRNRAIHKLRSQPGSRFRFLLNQFLCQLPLNLVRGLKGTESSQPISSTLLANWDLLRLTPRLLSSQRDQDAFQRAWQST